MSRLLSVASIILLVFGGLALMHPTWAQSSYKVSGYVLDSNGIGLSGAEIIFGVPDIVPGVLTNGSGYT